MRTTRLFFESLFILAALALPARGQSFLTNGLVLYYPFNGNANDASGNGNNGTVQGATLTTNRFGVPNSAYAFNGQSSYIQVPETIFGPSVSAVTVSMWVTTDNQNYPPQDLFEKSDVNGEMQMNIGTGTFGFAPNVSSYGFEFVTTPLISNAVTHLVGVYQQGQSVSLYTNGVLAANMSIPNGPLGQSTFPLASALGIYDYTPAPYGGFRGNIEDVRIYTNALTASQVQQLYQYESPSFLTNGLVMYYPFNGNANDASGSGNNGIVQGATLTTNRFGAPNSAYAFNGSSSLIQFPDSIFGPSVPAFTVSLWATTDNGPYGSGQKELFHKGSMNGEAELDVNSGQFGFGPDLVDPYDWQYVTAPMASNAVTHLVGVYQQGLGIWLYTNGVLAAELSPIPNANLEVLSGYSLASALGIYDYTPAPYEAFHGNIEDVRVYTNALSALQVQELYQYESQPPSQLPTGPPMINSFAPESAMVGTNVTINGLNFSPLTGSNIVYFGAVQADVIAASPTSLVVTVPAGATFAPITITVNGLTAYSDQPFLPTFPGNGQITTSSFLSPVMLPTGAGPSQVVFADLDGDGRPDLVIADSYAADISIYQNISSNGILAFAPRVVLPVVSASYGNTLLIAVSDVDGDGKPDLVALTSNSNLLYVYRNISSPGLLTTNSFASPIVIHAGDNSQGMAVEDLNGDGKPDIVTANANDDTVSVFQNQSTIGNISFAAPVNFATGDYPSAVAIGDLDGDGYPDLAVLNMSDGTLSVLRNLGVGGNITTNSFASQVVFPNVPQGRYLSIGDMDGDGKPDIIVADWLTDTISVLRNLTSGLGITASSFASPVTFPTGGWANNIALGDLGGTGKPDIATVCQLPNLWSIFPNISEPGSFTTNSLAAGVDFPSGSNPNGVAIGDLNGDGRPDVAIANQYDDNIYVFVNDVPPPVPVITNGPQDVYVYPYGTASFAVGAMGAPPLSFQWLFNGSDVFDATNNILTVPYIVPSDLGLYLVVVTNAYGAVTSSIASLYMYPSIVDPFTGLVTDWGQTNTLSVTAWGSGIAYQWYDNGIAILDATNSTFTLSSVQFTNAGLYTVVVNSFLGSVTNVPAQVVVNPAGVSLGLYPGVMVSGTVGYTYDIQSTADLTNTNGWTTVGAVTLTQPVQLWVDTNLDASLPANPHRFYRILPGP